MITIENDELIVKISLKGGEKQAIINKENQLNYLWDRNPIAWKDCAIPLFPIIGRLHNDSYEYDDKTFQLTSHGLARHADYKVVTQTSNSVKLMFQSDDETMKKYPFKFKFFVEYTLEGNKVMSKFIVENIDTRVMPFMIGGHPAFKIPLNPGEVIEDYYLEFSQNETTSLYHTPERFSLNNSKIIPLEKELFSQDAIMFENTKSNQISIVNTKGTNKVTMDYSGFPIIAIWASNTWNQLVALEPWYGHGDIDPEVVPFDDRKGTLKLAPAETFSCQYDLIIE